MYQSSLPLGQSQSLMGFVTSGPTYESLICSTCVYLQGLVELVDWHQRLEVQENVLSFSVTKITT